MIINEAVEKFSAQPEGIALGLSALQSVALDEIWPQDGLAVVVPANLVRLVSLIRGGSREHAEFLLRVVHYFNSSFRSNKVRASDSEVVGRLVAFLSHLEGAGRLVVLGDEVDDVEVAEAFSGLYPSGAFEIAMSPLRNFVRDYLVRIYSWSKRTGGVIIERTRRVFNDMGHQVATLQLPDRLDRYVDMKSKYVKYAFSFPGGKAAKFFLGVAVSAVGLVSPAASIAGLVIVFADP